MPLYTETGAINVVSNDTTKGRYSPTGALRINLVSGASYTGLYAADGAVNVVDISGISISTYGGLYHPCGALRGRTAPNTYSGLQAPDGSYYFNGLFSPINLFSNGEVGGWYDPSDLTTLFQDAAGTTPVTAVEQPVGLVLDKSRGLVLGSELVTNGGFDTDTWWSKTAGTTISGGTANLVNEAVGNGVYRSGVLTAGKYYEFRFTIVSISSGSIKCMNSMSSSATFNSVGTYSVRLLGDGGLNYIQFVAGSANTTASIDNVSVKEVSGSHLSQSTSTARPVLSARVNLLTRTEGAFNGSPWTKVNTTITDNTSETADPFGGSAASKVIETSATGLHEFYNNTGISFAGTNIISIYAKPSNAAGARTWIAIDYFTGSGNVTWFNLTGAGSVGTNASGNTSTITAVGGGWYRCTITRTATLTAFAAKIAESDGVVSYAGDTSKFMYFFGADARPANAGVGLPAYQRVGAATDYDTTGFPYYLRADGVDDRLIGPSIGNLISVSAYEACVGARVLAVSTSNASPWLNQSLLADGGGYFGVGYATTSNVIGAFNYDGTSDTATQPMTPPSTFVLQQRHDGGGIVLSLNGGSEASAASGNTTNLTFETRVFSSNGSPSVQAHIYGLVIRSTAFTATERANLRTWMNEKTKAF